MKNTTMMTALLLALSLMLLGCGQNLFKEAPLKDGMSFTYQEDSEYQGRQMHKTIGIRFEKRDDGMFDSIKTWTDKYGSSEHDPLKVDGFFKYNKIMDTLISCHPFYRDPKILASGNIGRMKVVESTYNGKRVYECVQGDHQSQYYDMETGFLEGAFVDTGKAKETIVRIK